MKTKMWLLLAVVVMTTGCAHKKPNGGLSDGRNGDSSESTIDAVTVSENGVSDDGSDGYYNQNGANSNSNSSDTGFYSIYFDFDGYDIAPSMQDRVQKDSMKMQNVGANRVRIEGNCDEFGTDEYNYALGLKRAKVVKDELIEKGVDVSNVVMVSLGEGNPVCNEGSDVCYARNRRVDFRLVK